MKKVITQSSGRRGFTLAELIMAIAMLSIFGVLIAQMFFVADKATNRARSLDQAVVLATDLAERWQGSSEGQLADPVQTALAPLLQAPRDLAGLQLWFDDNLALVPASSATQRADLVLHQLASSSLLPQATSSLWQLEIKILPMNQPQAAALYQLTVSHYWPAEEVVSP
jgi:prepilin-type N-terminal cleavage/methylation domain-containing protein